MKAAYNGSKAFLNMPPNAAKTFPNIGIFAISSVITRENCLKNPATPAQVLPIFKNIY